jgi:DNA-binding PadR family transcriptional regulator
MSLKYAVLAALLEGEASGYELSKVFDVSLANFWASTPQQLYRELERLAQDGLIEARVVRQERRPDKRMFTLTEAGREDLSAFAATPTRRPTAIRDELLIKIQAMDGVDPGATRALVEEREAWARGKLARYRRVRERLLAGRSEEEYLRETDRVGPDPRDRRARRPGLLPRDVEHARAEVDAGDPLPAHPRQHPDARSGAAAQVESGVVGPCPPQYRADGVEDRVGCPERRVVELRREEVVTALDGRQRLDGELAQTGAFGAEHRLSLGEPAASGR